MCELHTRCYKQLLSLLQAASIDFGKGDQQAASIDFGKGDHTVMASKLHKSGIMWHKMST